MQQIKINKKIQLISQNIQGENIVYVKNVMDWIKNNLKLVPHFAEKRSRNTIKIIKSGVITGCIDFTLLFISLCKAKGIKATYIETIKKKWLKKPQELIEGHIFSRVFLGNKEIIVDPISNKILKGKKFVHNDEEYILIKEGRDSWSLDFKNTQDLRKYLYENAVKK